MKWSNNFKHKPNLWYILHCSEYVSWRNDTLSYSHGCTLSYLNTQSSRLVSVFLLQNFSFITISSMPSKWCRFSYLLIGSNIPHLSTAMLRMAIAQKIFSLFLIAKHEYYHYQSHLSLLVNITIFINKQYVINYDHNKCKYKKLPITYYY